MTPEVSNATIKLSPLDQALNNDAERAAPGGLEEALQEMRKLKTGQELNARQIGLLVKRIIKESLWKEDPNCRSAEHCFQKKFKEIGSRTVLYRYMAIAERFSDDHVRQFGITRLEALLLHETNTGERLPADNLGDHKIRLVQKDGSEFVKRFEDCSANELTRSNSRRAKSVQAQAIKLANAKPGMLWKVVVAGVGIAMLVVADLLPSSWLSSVVALLGASTLLAGGIPLVRRGYDWFVSSIRSGQAVELAATIPSKAWGISRRAVADLKQLLSLFRGKRIVGGLLKLASKLRSLRPKQNHAASSAKAETPGSGHGQSDDAPDKLVA